MIKPKSKDEADIASEQEQYARDEALWRQQKSYRLINRGACYNCDEPTQRLFCDVTCQEDYEKRKKLGAKGWAADSHDTPPPPRPRPAYSTQVFGRKAEFDAIAEDDRRSFDSTPSRGRDRETRGEYDSFVKRSRYDK